MPHYCILYDTNKSRKQDFEAAACNEWKLLGQEAEVIHWRDWLFVFATGLPKAYKVEVGPTHLRALWDVGLEMEEVLTLQAKGGSFADATSFGIWWEARADGQLDLELDTMGIFPAYYWQSKEQIVVASSPGTCLRHPGTSRKVDWIGISQCLLHGQPVSGRTTWESVKRTQPWRKFHWKAGSGIREIDLQPYAVENTQLGFEESAERSLALLRESIQAIRQPSLTQMLSGGLDSRLLCGVLRESGKTPPTLLTLGNDSDQEMKIANRVAATLKWPRRIREVEVSRYPEWFDRQIANCHITAGVGDLTQWSLLDDPSLAGQGLITGYLVYSSFGRAVFDRARNPLTNKVDFEGFWVCINRFGFPPEVVASLLRTPNAKEAVEAAMHEARQYFETAGGSPERKALFFYTNMRHRTHNGKHAWRLAHASQPLSPYGSSKLLRWGFEIPVEWSNGPQIHNYLLSRFYPDLARLPLDRNTLRIVPVLVDGFWRRAYWKLWNLWDARFRPILNQSRKESDLYYFRMYDFDNNPGWRKIRNDALASAAQQELFHPAVLRQELDYGGREQWKEDRIQKSNGPKTLCGLVRWHKLHGATG
ncbi:MAG: hypothetical protein OHK0021_22590 [Bryobacter sp.]